MRSSENPVMSPMVRDLASQYGPPIETHISWVFLTADEVYKVKKPVNFGFLDFSSREKRRAACQAELELNRRLAHDVYLCVAPIVRGADGFRIGGEGETEDWAVCMRRLADADRADQRLEAGDLTFADIDRVARRLARFHSEMKVDETTSRYGSPDVVLGNVRENFEQTRDVIDRYLSQHDAEEIEHRQLSFVERHRDVFLGRVSAGRVRDGHGDLRLEHVYLESEGRVTILDCIEFNDRFRYGDVCADIAFLTMDLAQHGRVDLAEHFVAAYARESGDYDLYALIDFYESYRAYVRGKIASFVASNEDTPPGVRKRAEVEARRHFMLALAAERKSIVAPVVVLVGGIIGSGKSTVAERIGQRLGAPVIDSDRTRKTLAGVGFTTPLGEEAYTEERTAAVYREVFRRAERVLASGRPVVLDASFRTQRSRHAARQVAEQFGVESFFVECRADLAVIRERLRERERGEHISDGRVPLLDRFLAEWEPVADGGSSRHLVLDTARPLSENEEHLKALLPLWPAGFNQ